MQPLLKTALILDPLKEYNIAFNGLSLGKHNYHYDINDSFFGCFEKAEIGQAVIKLELLLEKANSMLVLDFKLSGKAKLVCDRCSQEYWQKISSADRLFVKFGDSFYEQTEDIVIIPRNETHFDVSQYIYEFVHLNLPARRIHPGGKSKEDNCDPVVLKKLNDMVEGKDKDKTTQSKNTGHWEALRKLKNN